MTAPAAAPAPPAVLPAAVNELTQAVADIDGASLLYLGEHPEDELAALGLLAAVRTQRIRLAQIEASIESLAVRRMTADRIEVGGVGTFERHGGTDRKDWDHTGLASRVVQSLLVDDDGVAVEPEYSDLAYLVRDRLLDAAAVTYWRVGKLKPLGIDANDYCTRTPGRRTIQFTAADPS